MKGSLKSDRRSALLTMSRYKKLIPVCCIPGCNHPNPDCHHIRPRKFGGDDSYHNLINLCPLHHKGLKLHEADHWDDLLLELYTYKYMAELTYLGITSDCGDDDEFIYNVAVAKAEKETP